MAYTVSVFKPTIIRHRNGKKRKIKGRVWWFAWRDEAGRLHRKSSQRITGTSIRNKRVARQYARKLEDELAKGNLGLTDPYSEHRKRPIEEHLATFEEVVRAREVTADHKRDTVARVRKIITGCGFKVIGDIRKARIEIWLGEQETKGGRSIGLETRNRYIWAIKHFVTFLVENQRMAKNDDPLIGLKKQKKKDRDRRYVRRSLTWEEFEKLLAATQQNSITRRNLTPVDRTLLYLLALFTGYRRGAFQQLAVRDFDLDGDLPSVTLPAEIAKGGRETPPTPLRPELAETIRRYIAMRGLGSEDRLFPHLTDRTAEVLRKDLEAAGIPVVDGRGRVIDLHALRFTFNAEMRRRGVELSVRQRLMHHGTPELTANTYGAVPQAEFVEAIEAMPPAPPVALLLLPYEQGE